MNYAVNLESLYRNFPADFEVPPLLLDFGDWLKDKRTGSLGFFRLESERFDDYWIENGADLHGYFAFFIRDPTGGRIGFWLYDGGRTVSPPIAMVGSEGELLILSDSIEGFLEQLMKGETQAADLDSRDNGDNEQAELAEWLNAHAPKSPPPSLQNRPDLQRWMDDWGIQQREWIDKDSLHRQIADKLRKFVKPDAEPWQIAAFDVVLVGTQFRMWHRSFGPKPMSYDEVADLEILFRSVREQRAQKMPERGLWFSAWVQVGSRGGATLCCNFIDEPEILSAERCIHFSDFKRDLDVYPRSEHWMPDWLKKLK